MAIWTVYPHDSNAGFEQHEYYKKDEQVIVRQISHGAGWFRVETSDDNPPEFEFDRVPFSDGSQDNINMYDCLTNNIEKVELVSMAPKYWEDVVWPTDLTNAEYLRLSELVSQEDGFDLLKTQEGWSQTPNDTQAWMWGIIQIENEAGEVVRTICADANGNVVDYVEE